MEKGRLYESCLLSAEELLRREPKNPEYALLLADTCVNRYIALKIAARLRCLLPLDEVTYLRLLAEAQRDPGKQQPAPPVVATYDDNRPYRLKPEVLQERCTTLKQRALSAYQQAVAQSAKPEEKAGYLHEYCWGRALLDIMEALTKEENPSPDTQISFSETFKLSPEIMEDMDQCLKLDRNNPDHYQSLADFKSIASVMTNVSKYKIDPASPSLYKRALARGSRQREGILYYLVCHDLSPPEELALTKEKNSLVQNAFYWYRTASKAHDLLKHVQQGNQQTRFEAYTYVPVNGYKKASYLSITRILSPQAFWQYTFLSRLSELLDSSNLSKEARADVRVASERVIQHQSFLNFLAFFNRNKIIEPMLMDMPLIKYYNILKRAQREPNSLPNQKQFIADTKAELRRNPIYLVDAVRQ